jgi:hypothetical protein
MRIGAPRLANFHRGFNTGTVDKKKLWLEVPRWQEN